MTVGPIHVTSDAERVLLAEAETGTCATYLAYALPRRQIVQVFRPFAAQDDHDERTQGDNQLYDGEYCSSIRWAKI